MNSLFNLGFWSYVGVYAGIYALMGLGLQIQLGYAGIVNFGVVGFMSVGAYAMAVVVLHLHWPLWFALIFAIATAGVAGVTIAPIVVRLRADQLAIATIAFGEIVRYLALNLTSLTGGAQGTSAIGGPLQTSTYVTGWNDLIQPLVSSLEGTFGTSAHDVAMLIIIWSVIILTTGMLHYWLASPWGRVLKAIRDDRHAAAALGKNITAYQIQALAIGSCVAGIAGLFFALEFGSFSPGDFSSEVTLFTYVIIIIGGLGAIRSVPLGAIFFAFLFAGTRFFTFPPFSLLSTTDRAFVRMIIIGLILILFIAFRPQGILGKKEELALD